MVNSKDKGVNWEREASELLRKYINDSFKRIPSSGAIGTILSENALRGDIRGRIKGINLPLKVECKVGYGGAKQMSIKKAWLDKLKDESVTDFSIPFILGKFSGARSGVKFFVIIDFDVFAKLLKRIEELQGFIDDKLG